MAVDSLAKRMAVAHIKRGPNKGVFPGPLDALERSAIGWNYVPGGVTPPTPGAASITVIGIGQKQTFVSGGPILGGGGGW